MHYNTYLVPLPNGHYLFSDITSLFQFVLLHTHGGCISLKMPEQPA